MEVLFEKISHNQVNFYYPYDQFSEVYPEPDMLLLSGGTDLNEIIRSFWIFTFIFEYYFLFSVSQAEQKKKDKISLKYYRKKRKSQVGKIKGGS